MSVARFWRPGWGSGAGHWRRRKGGRTPWCHFSGQAPGRNLGQLRPAPQTGRNRFDSVTSRGEPIFGPLIKQVTAAEADRRISRKWERNNMLPFSINKNKTTPNRRVFALPFY